MTESLKQHFRLNIGLEINTGTIQLSLRIVVVLNNQMNKYLEKVSTYGNVLLETDVKILSTQAADIIMLQNIKHAL